MIALRVLAVAGIALFVAPSAAAPGGGVVRVEHRDPSTVPTRGPANALVTIEVFFQPQVGRPRAVPPYKAVERLQATHPKRIRIVYRVMKRASNVQLLATATMEAHAQGKFDEFLDALAQPHAKVSLSREEILELGKKVGLDGERLASALTQGRYADVFEQNHRRWDRFSGSTQPPAALFNSALIGMLPVSDEQLEKAYVRASVRARILLDKGVAIDRLSSVFDDIMLRSEQPFVASSSPEDEYENEVTDHPLANPPLSLAGLPSFGKPNNAAPVPIVVLCRPNDSACAMMLTNLRTMQETYSNEIRLVFAPWFRITRDDAKEASELALLADAALCAEQLGSNPDDLSASPGWVWTLRLMNTAGRTYRGRVSAEKMIDAVAAELRIDSGKLSACRARIAGTTLEWIAQARRSGVVQAPATIIGGRIYHGLTSESTIKHLVEAELAPGVLARCATLGCSSRKDDEDELEEWSAGEPPPRPARDR